MGKVLETQIIFGILFGLEIAFFKLSCIKLNLFILSSSMATRKKLLFFFIDRLNEINLDYVRNIGAILIVRKPDNFNEKSLKKLQSDCLRRNIPLYIGNNIKTLFKLNSNRLYISAYNKVQTSSLIKINGKIDIIGSAHNISEIREKIQQGCKKILLSRIFKTSYENKKGWLGPIKFNLLTRNMKANFIALVGINQKNFNQLKNLNIVGIALSSAKKKAGNFLPAFYKK